MIIILIRKYEMKTYPNIKTDEMRKSRIASFMAGCSYPKVQSFDLAKTFEVFGGGNTSAHQETAKEANR